MTTFLGVLLILLDVLTWIIIIQFIISILIAFNVVNTYNDFVRQLHFGLDRLLEPLYRPFRRILPDTGALDFAPMVVLILISIAKYVIRSNVPVVYV